MKEIILSNVARQTLDEYFESYIGYPNNNDLWKRAFNYSRILNCLAQLDALIDDTYIIDERNFIIIADIAVVEYVETPFNILVRQIAFNN